ncbi:ABC transporter permease [Inquilinus sp. CA228]|uniref:ABC transporter permease n=1 Tax=Inquilinus sp. CA228 TaxID=3455609 RepID=UPI003F8D36F6
MKLASSASWLSSRPWTEDADEVFPHRGADVLLANLGTSFRSDRLAEVVLGIVAVTASGASLMQFVARSHTPRRWLMNALRIVITTAGLLLVWELLVHLAGLPKFILPSPGAVIASMLAQPGLLFRNALVTLTEIVLGIVLGTAIGAGLALLVMASQAARRWLMPIVVGSQALPVFALAPLLVLWLGYGMSSKIVMAVLIIFFPVTTSFFDGLRRIERGWLDLARVMNARPGAVLWQIRVPAALPAMASGVRVAAGVAPIGAIIGEWVGSSAGLGHLMLQANSRMQTDLLFAAVVIVMVVALALYAVVDHGARLLVRWQVGAP